MKIYQIKYKSPSGKEVEGKFIKIKKNNFKQVAIGEEIIEIKEDKIISQEEFE